MSEEDAFNLGQMMLYYCWLSGEGRKRAREIFKQILEAAEKDEEERQVALRAVGVEVEARSDDR